MTISKRDLDEAVSTGTAVVNNLLASLSSSGSSMSAGTSLVTAAGDLIEDMAAEITVAKSFWISLANVFDLARRAGATYAAMDNVRAMAAAQAPIGEAGQAIQDYAIQVALAELAQILAATIFVSRNDIDTAIDTINVSFSAAITTAANNFDFVSYQALVSLNAAVVADLSNREQTLPRIIWFNFPAALPALYLAQRIYQDGARGRELAQENKAAHPLFMNSPVRALSA